MCLLGNFGDKEQQDVFSPTTASINLLMFGSEGCDYDPADISHPSKIKEICVGSSSEAEDLEVLYLLK